MPKIIVNSASSSSKLNSNIAKGNTIVLYHMESCPHCVSLMPEWRKFIIAATKQIPRLTIGEVERTHINKMPIASSVTSFPTIIFYKANSTGPIVHNKLNDRPKFSDLLRNIINNKPVSSDDNEIMFSANRDMQSLLDFARSNISSSSTKTKKQTIKAKKTAPKTKKAGKRKGNITGKLSSNNMTASQYNNSKSKDVKIGGQIKAAFGLPLST